MGIAGCWYSIASGVYILFLGLLAGPLRKNLKTEALPDYLESRFSPGVARLQSYVWIIFGIIYIPIQLKTISSIIQIVLPGLNTGLAMFIGVTIAAIYTGFAGMKVLQQSVVSFVSQHMYFLFSLWEHTLEISADIPD